MGLWNSLKSLIGGKTRVAYNPDIDELQLILGYRFTNPNILKHALAHRSCCYNDTGRLSSNERLEFLGDSVLGLAIAELLYKDHPDLREGELTKTKALLVNETTLSAIGEEIGLNRFIVMSPEEDRSGGRYRPSIVSDSFESIMGAVYLDGGAEAARDLVFRLIYNRKKEILSDESQRNFKGELLELVQSRGEGMPQYKVISQEGPDHCKVFEIEVYIGSTRYGTGIGRSKKEAEQKAAAATLEKFSPQHD
jgi:ribonuclease-3